MHVAQVELRRLGLGRIFFVGVAQLADIGMTKQPVVVERHLRVEADDAAVLGDHQRIDFDQRRVGLDEGAVERREQRRELADLLVLEAQRERDLARLKRRQPEQRIDRLGDDPLGRLGGDFLDLHAAFGAGDHRDRSPPCDRPPSRGKARARRRWPPRHTRGARRGPRARSDASPAACRAASRRSRAPRSALEISLTPPALPRPPA